MSKKQKVKLNYPRIIVTVGISVLVIALVAFLVTKMSKPSEGNNPTNVVQQGNSSELYSIRSNATDYQKEIYDELKEALKGDSDKVIAECIAKNFIADFYTLSNKSIKNDVGGTQFWTVDARLGLRTKAIDKFYTNLELYIEDYGSENLPQVSEVTIKGSGLMDGDHIYAVEVEWDYVPNEKFDTSDFQNTGMLEITFESGDGFIYKFY